MSKVFKVAYYLFAILSGMMILTLILESVNRQASESMGYSNPRDNITTVSDFNDYIGLIVFILLSILFRFLWYRSKRSSSKLDESK